MPIYEYRCESCRHELDALQKLNDALLTDCPACGEQALRRLVSAPQFRLKGSGWYETDFKKDNRRNVADSGDGAAGGSKSGGGSDAKSKGSGAKNEATKEKKSKNGGEAAA